jgi:hypothetical protein
MFLDWKSVLRDVLIILLSTRLLPVALDYLGVAIEPTLFGIILLWIYFSSFFIIASLAPTERLRHVIAVWIGMSGGLFLLVVLSEDQTLTGFALETFWMFLFAVIASKLSYRIVPDRSPKIGHNFYKRDAF